jgi:hypothetical protein
MVKGVALEAGVRVRVWGKRYVKGSHEVCGIFRYQGRKIAVAFGLSGEMNVPVRNIHVFM